MYHSEAAFQQQVLKLEDLTKDELLKIIRQHCFEVSQHDILETRWHSLTEQANELMKRAQVKMEANIGGGIKNTKLFQEASEEFNKGLAISDEADKVCVIMRTL